MNASAAFAAVVEHRCDYECPAVQDAIDRLVKGQEFRGRNGMLEVLRGPHFTTLDFNASLLSAWNPKDVELVTGHNIHWWVVLNDQMGQMRVETQQHYRTEWTAIEAETYDGAEDSRSPMGSGRTEAEAITDLLEKMDDDV
jgi:hypothetical protein